MVDPVLTYVFSRDPISQAGVVSQLRHQPQVRLLGEAEIDQAEVGVVICDAFDESTRQVVHALRRGDTPRVVLVAGAIDDGAVVAAAECRVSGLLRRCDATPEGLVRTVLRVAAGDGEVPPDLLGRLLDQLGRLQRQVLAPRGLAFAGLSPREADVLRLVADGHDTAEIALQLCYSERTVKNVLHELTTRLQLRNRSHAVAYAMREGLI